MGELADDLLWRVPSSSHRWVLSCLRHHDGDVRTAPLLDRYEGLTPGSACFLVASWLAYAEINRGILPRSDRSIGWRISVANLVGSVAFGIAAVAAR